MIWVCAVANATVARRSPSARTAAAAGLIGSSVVVVVAWVELVAGTVVVVVAAVVVTGTVVVVTTVVGVMVVDAGIVVLFATVVVVVVAISVVVVVVVSGTVSSVVTTGGMLTGSDPTVSASGSGANCVSVGRVEMIMASPISILMVDEVAVVPALAGRTSAGGPTTRRFGSCLVSKPQALSTKRSTAAHR